jgi:hypothetical protein
VIYLPGFEPAAPEGADPSGDEWYTPPFILHWLGPIALDPCWAPGSHVRAAATIDQRRGGCGLAQQWDPVGAGIVFVNPPFSAAGRWLEKCRHEAARLAVPVVALVPAVPGDGPWAAQVWGRAAAVGFIRGRVDFTAPDLSVAQKGRGHALIVYAKPATAAALVQECQRRAAQHAQAPAWVCEV